MTTPSPATPGGSMRGHFIIPPYITQAIARNGSPDEREAALRSLARDEAIRADRWAAQPGGPDAGSEGAGVGPEGAAPGAAPGPATHRTVFDARSGTTLPGTPVRAEGGAPVETWR